MVEKDDNKIKDLFGVDAVSLIEDVGEIGHLLIRKSKLYDDISKLSAELVEAKTCEKNHLSALWLCTIWDEVITGRATDKTKKAYVDEHIRPFKEDCERIQNKIDECWRDVDLINDYFKIGGLND